MSRVHGSLSVACRRGVAVRMRWDAQTELSGAVCGPVTAPRAWDTASRAGCPGLCSGRMGSLDPHCSPRRSPAFLSAAKSGAIYPSSSQKYRFITKLSLMYNMNTCPSSPLPPVCGQ